AMPPLILVPPAGRHAVVRGDVIDGPARVQNGDPRGTYVYVGRARPVATAEVIAVVDPGMPRWLVEWLEAGLPRVMHRYGQLTGLAPRTRPTVLYTYHDDGSPGRSAGGGTLPGLITIALTGDGWGTPTDAARAEAFQLLAHEAFHLWNGERVTNAPAPTGAWIHEGSADVFATGASLHLGALDSASARGAQEAALNRCAMALARGSVESALARGQPRMVYDCGQVMAWWTGLALRSLNGGRSLDTFWRDLLAAGLAAGGEYDAALYIGLLARQGAGPATITAMQAFLTGSGTDSIAVAALQALGAPIVVHADPPTGVDQGALVAEAFAHLMQAACGRASFYGGAPIRTVPVSGCSGFARERHIARIAELPVGSAGAAIHDAVAARCAANGEVSIEEVDGSREAIPCTRPLQRRPPWYEVRALIVP
ncbi:MAG: hypothetical protein KC485_12545, partial [Gemmatimonadetes bacterium]|nr:hypothetical protein [Gemmatimonadota bacterium]